MFWKNNDKIYLIFSAYKYAKIMRVYTFLQFEESIQNQLFRSNMGELFSGIFEKKQNYRLTFFSWLIKIEDMLINDV